MGYSSGNILSIFLVEALVTGFAGGVIGAATGIGLSYLLVSFFGSGISFGGSGGGFGGGGGFFAGSSTRVAATGAAARTAATATASTVSTASTLSITPAISPELILLAVGLATLVGMLAGLLPAWRASRLSPVEALRQE